MHGVGACRYYTVEAALPDVSVELLIQKIGSDVRVFRRKTSALTQSVAPPPSWPSARLSFCCPPLSLE